MNNSKKIAKELRDNLDSLYPGLIKKLILFGSNSTGGAKDDSDIDILIVLKQNHDGIVKERIYEECSNLNLNHNVWIDINILSEEELDSLRGHQPFIQNALSGGIAV